MVGSRRKTPEGFELSAGGPTPGFSRTFQRFRAPRASKRVTSGRWSLSICAAPMTAPDDPESNEGGRASEAPLVAGEAVSAVILCGGASRRMGTDKAALPYGESTLLEHIVASIRPGMQSVRLGVGSSPRYESLGLPLVLDKAPGLGPLAGLEAALETSSTPWVWLVACDLPGLSAATGRALCEAAQPGDQVIQFGTMEQPEPLCALYHRDILGAVRGALAAGRRRMTSFLELATCDPIRVRWLAPRTDLENVNRPEEWERFLQRDQEDRS